jgi:hypothetical protein
MPSSYRSSLSDVALLGRATMDLFRIHLALRRYGFQHVITEIESSTAQRKTVIAAIDIRRAQRYGRRIATAAKYGLPTAQCLHRSLVLHSWLRDQGFPSELRIGVRKDGNELRAHAWVELAGLVVNDSPTALRQFTPLVAQGTRDGLLPGDWTTLGNMQWQ